MSAEAELRSRSILVGFVVGAVVGALLVGLTVIAAGGGHGSYVPAIVLFPYSMALAVPLGSIAPPLVGLAILQYPAYGVL